MDAPGGQQVAPAGPFGRGQPGPLQRVRPRTPALGRRLHLPGYEDTYRAFYGDPGPETLRRFYEHGARFGTTLQVRPDMWPADREAFEAYWKESVQRIEVDRQTRAYLRGIAEVRFLPGPLAKVLGPFNRVMTVGFLPQEFRDELGYEWTGRDRAVFAAALKGMAVANRLMPGPLRRFPFNVYLWDFRRRMRKGRSFV
nr:oxygenase MpaB family protein [Actinomadura sp. J1-007]